MFRGQNSLFSSVRNGLLISSGNTTQLLSTTTDSDRMVRTRNRCNSSGYESVALIPIRSKRETLGLMQLNDHRLDVFSVESIPFFENLASNIGMVISRNMAEERTKKLNAELELRVKERTARLESMNKELEAFSYSVSHDLRAPLRGIDGWSQALLEDYGDRLDEQGKSFLDTIIHETIKMGSLIDGMLKLARLSRTEMRTTTVDLSWLAQEIADRLKKEAGGRMVEVIIQPGQIVLADPVLMESVLSNLFENAFKFTGKVDAPVIEFGQNKIEDEIVYFIKDNGAGFNMKYADKLFGTFQRMHQVNEFPGTGVGLATVQRIIHRHGGKIWAYSEINNGATFFFTIPPTI